MSEQPQPTTSIHKQVEGKYKYLADFKKQQVSPAYLKKRYNDSFFGHQNSLNRYQPHSRQSPLRLSPPKLYINKLPPSCTTFNPGRQSTHQQFSPYDQQVQEIDDDPNKQLLAENALLRTEISKNVGLIQSQGAQLAKKEQELIQIRDKNQADIRYFKKVVQQMTEQIQLVLTRNKMLESQLFVANSRLQQQVRRHQIYVSNQEERRQIQQGYRQRQLDKVYRQRESIQRNQDKKQALQQAARRSVGKLMVKSSQQPVGKLMVRSSQQPASLDTSKIKIEEDELSQTLVQTKLLQQKTDKDKQSRKKDEFIASVKAMKFKISSSQQSSLHQLWKWLKGIGHSQSNLKRWKSRAENNADNASQKLKDLIKEACSYLQQQ